jgi:ADP-ribose pyrophosphatase
MKSRRRVDIRSQKRLFDDFFKIDEYAVSYELFDKNDAKKIKKKDEGKKDPPFVAFAKPNEKPLEGMSEYVRRLNFERGDAVGVLLFNLDTRSVVLVDQFKLPTLIGRRREDSATQDGWIVEVMAGMIPWGETPEETAVRETMEETGYEIEDPEFICKFLSSPGGTSERIFLYFATVTDSRRPGADDIGVGDENIRTFELDVNQLLDRLAKGLIDDPKLAIAAYWLKDNLARFDSLEPSTVRYAIKGKPGLIIGYKTGDIKSVGDVDIWVNSENTNMMMDRIFGTSISAKIRALGANKDDNDNIIDDTIQESLRGLLGDSAHVRIGTVLVTESGLLRLAPYRVRRLFHVASGEGGLGAGVRTDPDKLKECVARVLVKADQENNRLWRQLWNMLCLRFEKIPLLRFRRNSFDSILIPMIGAGDGGVPIETVAKNIIPAAVEYFEETQNPTLKEIYFLAFKLRDKCACDRIFDRLCEDGRLVKCNEEASAPP